MKRLSIAARTPYDDSLAYSRIVAIGNQAWISATAPFDENGSVVGIKDAYKQAQHCLKLIIEGLNEAEFQAKDIVRTRIYLISFEHVDAVSRAHKDIFDDTRPACCVVTVSGFVDPDMLVYIEADAYRM